MEQSQQWSEYWQNEGAGAEVFVDKDGKKSPHLERFWKNKLAEFNPGAKIIDIASGAGSVFASLDKDHTFETYAQDISEVALDLQCQRIKGVTSVLCSADKIPYEDNFFDVIVSQFGIEYAGVDAFIEAARIMADTGKFVFLSHYEDGYIDSQNKIQLEGISLIEELDFIDKSVSLTQLAFNKNTQDAEKIMNDFTQAEPVLEKYSRKYPKGVHSHLYHGYKQLFSNRTRYLEKDILEWLTGMRNEVVNAKTRLTEMRKAAVSKEKLQIIIQALKQNKIEDIVFEPMTLENSTLPVAWQISGIKRG